ncbi:MAG: heat-inducible transcriptional repressor HrcA [Rhodobacteraceae bacterium]|nr:heat-inducible transcriptional repressor HrcA [Paracoccaceae bacterium]
MRQTTPLSELNDRSREVFRLIVESYLDSGEPVGSRTLSRQLAEQVSAATIRNTMQDLEHLGLLNSPHTSAGRLPTQQGLRLFVDGLLEIGGVSGVDRDEIEKSMPENSTDIQFALDRAGSMLSGLTQGASLVLAPKTEAVIKHIEFVSLGPERALVVLVTADGQVENRIFTPPTGMTPSAMREAANFLNAVMEGHTVNEFRDIVSREVLKNQNELNTLSQKLIQMGVAMWAETPEGLPERLIVRGRANLLEENANEEDIERIRLLFDDLERKRDLENLLNLTEAGDGVRVFIGSENKLFSLSGSSLVVSPYMNSERKIVGAVGVIGPTHLNYARIVPIVDYTAQLMGRLISTSPRQR